MSNVCPNCGFTDGNLPGRVFDGFCHCPECGTSWTQRGHECWDIIIPRRSQPAEVLEQIVGNDDWWWKKDDSKVAVDGWIPIYAPKAWVSGRGQYVRAVPPLVKPPLRDADAEWLRAVFCGKAWSIEDKNKARRIADRLEKGAERE